MANILIKQGYEIAVPDFVITTDEARKVDLTSVIQTGTTSSQAISAGTYFYLNNVLVRAKVDIANGATFTLNTNYEVVTAGALNELKDAINGVVKVKVKSNISAQVATANNYVSVSYDLPSDMTTYLGSIIVVRSVNANWAFTSGQVDMHLYNVTMHDIRFTASVAQTYTVDVLTYYI